MFLYKLYKDEALNEENIIDMKDESIYLKVEPRLIIILNQL